MDRTKLALALALVWTLGLALSIVFHSSDPGARGAIADVAFFAWLLSSVALLVLGAAALVRRMTASGPSAHQR